MRALALQCRAMTEEQAAALRKVPLFAGLSDRDLEKITENASEEHFEAGQDIVTQGDTTGPFFLILEGRCKVTIDGKPKRTLGPGQYFGEMALLDDEPRSATVRAETAVRGIALPPWDFLALLEANWPIARKVMASLSRRLRQYNRESSE